MLPGGKALGMDGNHPDCLKLLDVIGLFWLPRFSSIVWLLRTVVLVWQAGVVVPLFKKGDRRVCSNYQWVTIFSLPGKVYSNVVEWRI